MQHHLPPRPPPHILRIHKSRYLLSWVGLKPYFRPLLCCIAYPPSSSNKTLLPEGSVHSALLSQTLLLFLPKTNFVLWLCSSLPLMLPIQTWLHRGIGLCSKSTDNHKKDLQKQKCGASRHVQENIHLCSMLQTKQSQLHKKKQARWQQISPTILVNKVLQNPTPPG